MCHNPIGPCRHRWAPPWRGTSNKWTPNMPRGTHSLVNVSIHFTRQRHMTPYYWCIPTHVSRIEMTWQHLMPPHHQMYAMRQHTIKPPHHLRHNNYTHGQIWLGHIVGHISTVATWQCVSDAQWWEEMPNGSTQRSHLDLHATWQSTISPPHHYGSHPSTSHMTSGPHHSVTWQSASGPYQPIPATWHSHRKPFQHACATWHHTTEPPQ
jgi:hypothetical protein